MSEDKIVTTQTEPVEVGRGEDRQALAREYARIQRLFFTVELCVSLLLMVGFLVSGASRWFKLWLFDAGVTNAWVLVGVYAGALFVGYTLFFLPFSWRRGYVVPHRYHLSTQTVRGWWTDELKILGLGLVFGVPLAEVVYWLLRAYPETWWLWAAAVLIAFSVLLGFLMPVMILPLFYKLVPLEDAVLTARIQQLAERTGHRIAGVYTINLSSRTTAANAMVIGMGATKRIALGDTLYETYTPEEIETILAHELGHQVHHDMELSVLVQSGLWLGSLYLAQRFLQWGIVRFGFDGPGDVAALPLLVLAVALFSFVSLPLINGYSRWRERLADRFALRVTGNAEAFARAMMRLAHQNLAELDPPVWVVWLLHDHPPIRERIQMAISWTVSEGGKL